MAKIPNKAALLLVLLVVLLGAGLLFKDDLTKNKALPDKKSYTILALGEDTTAEESSENPWPGQLEEILNKSGIGKEFKVINAGVPDTITTTILAQLEENLDKYKPDIVVAMMGINDVYHPHPPTRYDQPSTINHQPSTIGMSTSKYIIRDVKASEHDLEEQLKQAVEQNPNSAEVYVQLGNLYDQQGRYEEAEKVFKKALELDSQNDAAYIGLGQAYRHLGKLEEAEKVFNDALTANPNNEQALFNLGNIYRTRGDLDKTEEYYNRALQINPNNDWLYIGLGHVYREKENFNKAEEVYKKAIELVQDKPQAEQQHALAYFELGKTYRYTGRTADAEEVEKKSRELFPKTAQNYRKIKEILDKRGIPLMAVQYPFRQLGILREMLGSAKNVVYVSNGNFEETSRGSYGEYFVDRLYGDFGRATSKGNRLLAENIANAVIERFFK